MSQRWILKDDCPECGGDVVVVPSGAWCEAEPEACGWSEREPRE